MIELNTEQAFEQYIAEQTESLVVVYFWSSTCPVCQRATPELEKAGQQAEEVNFAQVELQKLRELFKEYNIRGTPTVILFSDGEELARFVGFREAKQVVEWITEHIATQQ